MGYNSVNPMWSQEDLDRLVRLQAEGKTFGDIAEVLNRTRSAIGGKCKRLGLAVSPLNAQEQERRRAVVRESKPRVMFTPRADNVMPLNVPLLTRGRFECSYPYGAACCGHPIERGSYCASHANLCYTRRAA